MFASKTLAVSSPCLHATFCEESGHLFQAGAVAVGRECPAFRLWIDDLASTGNEALMQLRECGFVYDLAGLRTQLLRALKNGPAGPLARIVGQRVLDLVAAHHDAVCFFLEEAG
jgi:hypothetical protein